MFKICFILLEISKRLLLRTKLEQMFNFEMSLDFDQLKYNNTFVLEPLLFYKFYFICRFLA